MLNQMTIVAPPVITMPPTNKTVDILQNVTLVCEAMGFKVRYEWRRHKSSGIIGNQSILIISKIIPFDEDFYYCTAVTDGGHVVSNAALLTVNCENCVPLKICFLHYALGNIIITMQPRNITTSSGSNITLSVTAVGVGLKYHWKKRGHNLLPGNATGQHTAHLNFISVAAADSGSYFCVIKNQWGSKLHSDDAILNVLGKSHTVDLYSVVHYFFAVL